MLSTITARTKREERPGLVILREVWWGHKLLRYLQLQWAEEAEQRELLMFLVCPQRPAHVRVT